MSRPFDFMGNYYSLVRYTKFTTTLQRSSRDASEGATWTRVSDESVGGKDVTITLGN